MEKLSIYLTQGVFSPMKDGVQIPTNNQTLYYSNNEARALKEQNRMLRRHHQDISNLMEMNQQLFQMVSEQASLQTDMMTRINQQAQNQKSLAKRLSIDETKLNQQKKINHNFLARIEDHEERERAIENQLQDQQQLNQTINSKLEKLHHQTNDLNEKLDQQKEEITADLKERLDLQKEEMSKYFNHQQNENEKLEEKIEALENKGNSELGIIREGDRIEVYSKGKQLSEFGVFLRIEDDFLVWVNSEGHVTLTDLDYITIKKL